MYNRISEEILRLIYNYVKNNKKIDNAFVEKVVEIVVINLRLNDYVKYVKINNKPRRKFKGVKFAAYDNIGKRLLLNLQRIIKFETYQQQYLCFDDTERIFDIYRVVTQAILHEIEHAKQYKQIASQNNDIETRILRVCLRHKMILENDKLRRKLKRAGYSNRDIMVYIQSRQSKYREAYKYAPHERLAEIYSHSTMLEVVKFLKQMCPNLSLFESLLLYETYLRGYDMGIPTKYFLEQIGSEESWPKLEDMGQGLSLQRRLYLGLNIAPDEREVLETNREALESMLLN